VTLNATNIPAGQATLTLTAPALPTPITLPITLVPAAGAYNPTTASVTLPSLFTTLTNGSADDVTCSGTLSWTNAQGTTQTTGSTANIFTFDVPEIVAATPGSAPFDQSTGVVFALEEHLATSGFGTATFGTAAAQAAFLFQAGGQTLVSTTAPPQTSPGPVSVRLQFGNEITLEQRGFVYLGPGVTSLSATTGWQAGGESLSLGLYGFTPGVPVEVRLGNGAQFGSTSGVPSGVSAASSVTITTPFQPQAGVLDLEVVQFAGQPNEKRALSPGAWLSEAPRIASLNPSSAFQGGGETVQVQLEGFPPNAATQLEIGTQVYTGTNTGSLAQSTFSLLTQLSPTAGSFDVRARQAIGTPQELSSTLPGGFTFIGPAIASLFPISGPLEGGTTVVVQTSGFQEGVPAQVSLGGFTTDGSVVGSGLNQTVTFRTLLASAPGTSGLLITQGVFQTSLANAFTFDAPRITAYCEAKLTSQGQLPVIWFTGSPSGSTGDFRITLSNALPNKTAQYVYGQSQNDFPLWGGKLCVAQGIVRGPVTVTNGSGGASVAFNVVPGLVGSTRYFQYWFRDPQDPAGFGYGLTGGMRVEFYP
jgi:hypothetical protein